MSNFDPPPHAPHLRLLASPQVSDAALCEAHLRGDEQAFGQLVHRHQDGLFRLLRRFAQSDEEALELAQRALVKSFEAASRALPRLARAGQAETFSFRSWLFRIAINLKKNQVRDAKRWAVAPLEAIDTQRTSDDAHVAFERAEKERLMRAAVHALTPRQRDVFALRIDASLSFSEVADALGITEANAKTHFHYAVARLRKEVQALMGGAP
jgi:RNA polymerase sigma-70 factor (ECF subfamily)